MVASGGALLGSPVWLQIVADALGRPVATSLVNEASARGATLLALEALGQLDDAGEAPAYMGPSCVPDSEHHEIYREAMQRQQDLYDRLIRP